MNAPATIEMVAPNNNANYVKLWDQYHDLAALAFQLDLTRTATILYGHGNNAWNGIHSTAHGGSADKLANGTRQYMDMIAKFVKRMSDHGRLRRHATCSTTRSSRCPATCPNGTTTPTSPTW